MSYNPPSGFFVLPPVVKNILIINVLVFLAIKISLFGIGDFILDNFASYYFASPKFKIWQLITYAFTHKSFGHLFFNMFAVFMFGNLLENYLGSKRFLQYYVICAVGAIILEYLTTAITVYNITGTFLPSELRELNLFDNNWQMSLVGHYGIDDATGLIKAYLVPTIGASGAVFGLLLAFGWLFPNMLVYIYFLFPVKAKYFVIVYGLIEIWSLISKGTSDGVAHYAHLGGILVGFIMLKIWKVPRNMY
ncbi:MAG: rhomboid family intramembrane serine protease [Solitalea-like symbiont of Acarus siro]